MYRPFELQSLHEDCQFKLAIVDGMFVSISMDVSVFFLSFSQVAMPFLFLRIRICPGSTPSKAYVITLLVKNFAMYLMDFQQLHPYYSYHLFFLAKLLGKEEEDVAEAATR